VKHILVVSKKGPEEAAVWQEAICQFATMMTALTEFKGGSVPFLSYIVDKCDLPDPAE